MFQIFILVALPRILGAVRKVKKFGFMNILGIQVMNFESNKDKVSLGGNNHYMKTYGHNSISRLYF